ncbi:MAG: iron chelate uptake ABC transporter family permease subunit [Proteobacteria bacterium]|nr:iron chelate uptake ABC transporter family permease subunit [Pseudomonadota bacterium]
MRARILLLTGLLVLVSALWLFQGLGPNRDFVLGLRLGKLAALLLVAVSVGVATILFQTVAQNRILTPAIMGFDALYLLIQSLLVASLGTAAFASLPAGSKFAAETLVMAAVAVALFGALLGQARGDSIGRTILTGVILGILFRSGATLVGRMLDPNEYSIVQQVSFANFSRPATDTTAWAAAAALPAIAAALWLAPRFDVLALGRERAISLGLPHRPMVLGTLALVAVLTAVSTALVGPVALFGLIIAGFAHAIAPGARHLPLLIAAALIASVLLVGGQWAFERVLGQKATLSVVIDFAGGVFFLALLLKGKVR